MRRVVDEVIAEYEARSLIGGLPYLGQPRRRKATTTSTAFQHDLRALAQRFIDDVINARGPRRVLVEMVAEHVVELNPLPGQGLRLDVTASPTSSP